MTLTLIEQNTHIYILDSFGAKSPQIIQVYKYGYFRCFFFTWFSQKNPVLFQLFLNS
jgi:hypothetical protein